MSKIALLLLLFSSELAAQTLSPQVQEFVKVSSGVIVLSHVRVIDGTGAPALENQAVIVRQDRIEWIGDASTATMPKEARVLDLSGESVIPGLVGMHDHMFYPAGEGIFHEMPVSFPRLYLAGGVTSIRTTGSIEPYTDLQIKEQIDRGQIPGPHMHVTGPYLEGPGSWSPQMTELKTAQDAEATVNFWVDRGVDNFKV